MLRSLSKTLRCQAHIDRLVFTAARSHSSFSCLPPFISDKTLLTCKEDKLLVVPRYFPPSAHFCTGCTLLKEKNGKGQEKGGIIKKFKKMMKDYWYVLIPVHVATSIVWFGGFYIMLKSGVDIVGMLEAIGTSDRILDYLRNSEAGYYALSYACYKIATPARYTVTVGGTTLTIAKLKDTGYLKSTSEFAEKMKDKSDDMKEKYKYEERKDKMEDKLEDLKEKAAEKKDQLKDNVGDAWEKVKDRTDDIKDKAVDKKDQIKDNVEEAWEKLSKKKK